MEAEQIWLWEKYLWGTGEYRNHHIKIFWSRCIHTLEQHGPTRSQEQGPVKAHENMQILKISTF
jgi:hypothetical protein